MCVIVWLCCWYGCVMVSVCITVAFIVFLVGDFGYAVISLLSWRLAVGVVLLFL